MSQPTVVRSLSGFTFSWPDLSLTITLMRIRESSQGLKAELVASHRDEHGKERVIIHQSCNLLTSKARLASELGKRQPAPWDSMLEQVCVTALRDLRLGEPVETLTAQDEDLRPSSFVLNPLLYEDEPTVIFGPGDSLKSFFLLYCALLLCNGADGPHLRCSPEPRRVLWLDWEMSRRNVAGRVRMLQRGHPHLVLTPDYRRMTHGLADTADEIRGIIEAGQYDVMCIDSLGMAAGARELEKAESPIAFFSALRGLGLPTLIIGHSPKPRDGQPPSLYGNVYFRNLARVSWEVRREGNIVGLYQDKNNLGPAHDPLGWTLDMHEDVCAVSEGDLLSDPALASHLPLQDQIAAYLKRYPGSTPIDVAEGIHAKHSSVKSKLHACPRFIAIGEGKYDCLDA